MNSFNYIGRTTNNSLKKWTSVQEMSLFTGGKIPIVYIYVWGKKNNSKYEKIKRDRL